MCETSGRQENHAAKSTEWKTSVGDGWETNVKPREPRVENQLETSVKSRGPEDRGWETSERQVGDKSETSVKACGPEHPEWNASPETKAKSCGPGMQPFERSKNPIQVNLFGGKKKGGRQGRVCVAVW